MTYDEAVTVTGMAINAFPTDRDWNADQIKMYARGIQGMDAEIATRAVLQAQKTLSRRPDVASLIAIGRSISVGAAACQPVHKPKPMPHWVRRWCYARFIQKPPDMRVFPEQRDWSNPDAPLMPLNEYAEEAQRVTDRQVIGHFGA